MSYHNGQQTFYGQPSNLPPSQPATDQYDSYAPQHNATQSPHLPRRMPSYNAGDDSQFLSTTRFRNSGATDGNAQYPAQISGYANDVQTSYNRTSQDYGNGNGRLSGLSHAHDPSRMSPIRTSSQSAAMSNSQYGYGNTSASRPAYNPQQYGFPQSQTQPNLSYNTLNYTAPVVSPQVGTISGHQPYNPAAYQSAVAAGLGSPTWPPHRPSDANSVENIIFYKTEEGTS